MRKPLDKTDLQVLSRINASPDGRYLLAILKQELESADDECRRLDSPAVHRSQGAAKVLVDIIATLEGARDKLEALNRPARQAPVA